LPKAVTKVLRSRIVQAIDQPKSTAWIRRNFFLCWLSQGGHLFDHFLWPIFQSSVTHITNYNSSL
jgi:hypothetical protein